jgi:RNA polymerase sigma factor (TIGR02999 family)
MNDITQVLAAIERGESQASEQLLPLVYEELRKLAARKLAHEKPGQTLQATALVHEAYLRLVDTDRVQNWDSRGHFFAAAAESMRRILVERARSKASLKHGGDLQRNPLDEAVIAAADGLDDILSLNEALDRFATVDPQAAELVKLRYFAGLTTEQSAEVLGISARSAYHAWTYARTWLHQAIQGE